MSQGQDLSIVQYDVHIGTWTNFARGPILGATLTLSRRDGNLLIAFTAFFVGMVSARFWRIICLIFHRILSTPQPRDALHHQRQALLRNSATAESAITDFARLCWSWRRSKKRSLMRTLPVLALSVFSAIAFIVIGGFSSRISTGIGDEVLIKGSNCGLIEPRRVPDQRVRIRWNEYQANMASNAANYAQQCYSSTDSGLFDCTTFVTSNIPVTINDKADCPFENGICRGTSTNIFLDSGLIDSHLHLGINSPDNERILFRTVLQCGPLQTGGYKSETKGITVNYTDYNYGSAVHGTASNVTSSSYTFRAESQQSQYHRQDDNWQRANGASFRLANMYSPTFNGSTRLTQADFIPNADLNRTDGDLMLFFLSGNGVRFTDKTEDEWYRATTSGVTLSTLKLNDTTTSYETEEAASPMGCIEQFQYCNAALPAGKQCGPLAGFLDAAVGAAPFFGLTAQEFENNNNFTEKIASRYLWFVNSIALATVVPVNVVTQLGTKALLSIQKQVNGVQQGALPSNQWQLDATHWFNTWLASLQAAFVTLTVGPKDPLLEPYRLSPADAFQQDMCNNQKVQNTMYSSFSLFGLYFTFLTGGLIVVLSFVLEPIYDFRQRRRKVGDYGHLEWVTNSILELQRTAFQALGRGTWSNRTNSLPITQPAEEKFESLTSAVALREQMFSEGKALTRSHDMSPGPYKGGPYKGESTVQHIDHMQENPIEISRTTTRAEEAAAPQYRFKEDQ